MKRVICVLFCSIGLVNLHSAFAQTEKTPAPFKIREGAHNLTLQWISWDNPGKVQISKLTDSTYSIKGEQRNNGDEFVTIDGSFKVVSPRELSFTGTIQTRTNTVNKGEVCNKTGTYRFYAKDQRKYWRLQEMVNCEGNNVVDYVDIFF